jgi:alkanesulfonate monooxygenase
MKEKIMANQFYWQLPTSGDARYGDATKQRRGEASDPNYPVFGSGLTDPRKNAFNYYDYIHQVTKAADLSGFTGVFIPDNPNGEEPWIVAGYIARSTQRLRLLTQFDASRGSAVYAAKNAVSFQRYTGGRFAWHITEGSSDEHVRKQLGDFVPKEDIWARIDEFITVAKGVITSYPFNFVGRFFEVQDGGFQGPLSNRDVPHIYLGGKTAEQLDLSLKHADVHVLEAAEHAEIAKQIAAYQKAAKNRETNFALRIDVLARETREEALSDAKRFLGQTERPIPKDDSALLWHEFSTEYTDAKASLIGSYDEVAASLAAYANLGVSQFVLAAVPHFEEAYRVGSFVLPLVRELTNPAQKQAA